MSKQDKQVQWTPAALMAYVKGDIENALIAATPGGIEAQELAGQVSFVQSETLPKEANGLQGIDLLSVYAALGIEVLGKADDLFYSVKLPEGWHKEAENHAMWSRLVDNKGRERATIFYKAAFYDRSAHINFTLRYRSGERPVGGWDAYRDSEIVAWECYVTDCGQDIFVTEPTPSVDRSQQYETPFYELKQGKRLAADQWLAKHFPMHNDPSAYWD